LSPRLLKPDDINRFVCPGDPQLTDIWASTTGGGSRGGSEDGGKERPAVSDIKVITRLKCRFDGIGYFGDLRHQVLVVGVSSPARPTRTGWGSPAGATAGT
jgi:hypothetical protein